MSKAQVTKAAPAFKCKALMPDSSFGEVELKQFAGKYVCLFFYPCDFTFVCPTEILAFSDRVEEFNKIGCEVIGASTDSVYSHLGWVQQPRKQGGLGPKINIPLLADPTHALSKDFGVYLEEEGHATRGLFIINGQGVLKVAINFSPECGRDVDETLRIVQALQYSEKHGDVCPAGWKPGQAAIKPSNASEFFNKQAAAAAAAESKQ